MKNLKKVLALGLSLTMICSLGFVGCGNSSEDIEETIIEETATLSKLTLDYSNAKTTFVQGEEFSAEGLTAVATFADGSTKDLTLEDLTVNSSAYKSARLGSYTISVSYTSGNTTKSSSYPVTVVEKSIGLALTYDGSELVAFDLTEESPTVSIDTTKLECSLVINSAGALSESVLTSGVTYTYYANGDEQVDSLSNIGEGEYQIWASYDYSDSVISYTATTFVIVVVYDNITSIAYASGTTSQDVSARDTISSTWTFTATYATGKTSTLSASDVTIGSLTTTTAGTYTTTATYTYTNSSGSSVSVTCDVEYTINAPTGKVTTNYSYSYDELWSQCNSTDKTKLSTLTFSGSNAFLTYIGDSSSDVMRDNGAMEVKGDALSVTFIGTGSISINFSSNGSSNASSLSLKDSSGNILTASDSGEATVVSDGVYQVTGTQSAAQTIVWNITESGTYIISTNTGSEGRIARIFAIDMEDTVDNGTEVAKETVYVDMATVYELTASGQSVTAYGGDILATGVSLIGTESVSYTVEYNKKAYDDTTTYYARLKMSGAISFDGTNESGEATTAKNGIALEVAEGAFITLYVRSSSDSADRVCALYNSSYEQVETYNIVSSNGINKIEIEISSSGIYYFGSTSGGIGIYNLSIEY